MWQIDRLFCTFLFSSGCSGSATETTKLVQVPKLRWGVPYRAPFFVSEVLRQLEEVLGKEAVDNGGLKVYTTLDLSVQVREKRSLK